jgi:ABC-2 type transport system ATP-binding protein
VTGEAVRVVDVVRRFRGRAALDGVHLTLPRGAVYGLVGPNGAGKTTLMRLIVGLDRPTSGTVELFGRRPAREALARVGYMTQAEAIYGDLSPRENLAFFAELYGLEGPRREAAIHDALRLVELVDRADDRVDTLSGGMRRRASLACAVLHDPSLVLLDEPTVGVDPALRASFWDHFMSLKARGAALLVTTHHLDEASRCDRLLLLKEGRIIAAGSAAALLAESGTDSVEAAFLHFARRGDRASAP